MNDLKLLGMITEQKNEKKINRLLNSYSIVNKYSFLGYGSASSSTLEYFGLHDIEKSVILSLIPENIKNEVSEQGQRGTDRNFVPLYSSSHRCLPAYTARKEVMSRVKCEYGRSVLHGGHQPVRRYAAGVRHVA